MAEWFNSDGQHSRLGALLARGYEREELSEADMAVKSELLDAYERWQDTADSYEVRSMASVRLDRAVTAERRRIRQARPDAGLRARYVQSLTEPPVTTWSGNT